MRWIEPLPAPILLGGFHPLVAQTLARRGLSTPDAARAFLSADSYSPSPASALPGLVAAVERISHAIRTGEPICIWGDFDVDGQTSTTVLVQTLQALGADVTYHIPVRAQESHGVNIEHLARVIAQGAKLVVTCDTGISATEAVAYATSRGVDMLITDHHDLPAELPKAAAVVNPKLLPGDHPLASLAGVGVAYKLAEALLAGANTSSTGRLDPADLLDLAALGLVADLALLTGDTRYLVQRGLEGLRQTKRLGLKTMMELAGLAPTNLSEEHIGFMLAPRLNALGRLGDANPAVELLTTSDASRARLLATQLEGLNTQRKLLCAQVTQAAEAQLKADPALLAQPVIILGHASWPGGVVGIAASRLVDRYRKPVILLCGGADGLLRGSARSVDGLNITAAITAQQDILRGFGGHPMAAGLSLETEKLAEFRRRMAKTVEKMLAGVEPEALLPVDGWLDLPGADLALAEQLESLAPYGPGNEKLILATRTLKLENATTIGRNKEHVRLTVSDEAGNSRQVLWWNGGDEDMPTGRFDLAYSLRASDWQGVRQAQMEFVAFRAIALETVEVKNRQVTVIDCRGAEDPLKALGEWRAGGLVWAEGADKKTVEGLDRRQLTPSETLVVWTTPPSLEELKAALETVQPGKLVVFAIDPHTDDMKVFLERLAGLVKFSLNHKDGRATLIELAAATAQKETVIRLGLEWLAKRGQVTVSAGPEGQITLTAGGSVDEASALAVETQLRSLLNETAAFRAHFQKADIETMIGQA